MYTEELIYNNENASPNNHVEIIQTRTFDNTTTTNTTATNTSDMSNGLSNNNNMTSKNNTSINKSEKRRISSDHKNYFRNPFKKRIVLKDVTTSTNNNNNACNNIDDCTKTTTAKSNKKSKSKKTIKSDIRGSKPKNIIDYAEQASLCNTLESNNKNNINNYNKDVETLSNSNCYSSLYNSKKSNLHQVTKKVLSSTKRRLLKEKKNTFRKSNYCNDLNDTTKALSRVALGIYQQNNENNSTTNASTSRPISYSISGSMVYRNLEKQGIIMSSQSQQPSSSAETNTTTTASTYNNNNIHHIMSSNASQDDLESVCSTLPSCSSWFQKY